MLENKKIRGNLLRNEKYCYKNLEDIEMPTFLLIAQILVAAALIGVILLQIKGGGLGGIFGQPDSVYRTRRGVEKSLFQFTVALAIVFIVIAIVVVAIGS